MRNGSTISKRAWTVLRALTKKDDGVRIRHATPALAGETPLASASLHHPTPTSRVAGTRVGGSWVCACARTSAARGGARSGLPEEGNGDVISSDAWFWGAELRMTLGFGGGPPGARQSAVRNSLHSRSHVKYIRYRQIWALCFARDEIKQPASAVLREY
eukprot:6182021-Pleurochrysis_carterae.AAC.1